MLRLAAVVYVLVATVIGGTAVTVALTLGAGEGWQIVAAFGLGLVVAVPLALVLGKKIYNALNVPVAGATARHA